MAYIRRLPSGKWQATVRDPAASVTPSPTRSRAFEEWAPSKRPPSPVVTSVTPGSARSGRPLACPGDAARGIEEVTKAKNASLWRTHCEPMGAGRWPRSPGWRHRTG